MRFGRLQCDGEGAPLGIEELAVAGQLDYLQLDYPRPRWTTVEGHAPAELPEYAVGFGDALRAIVKPLYLDPQLHVIASAGWGDAFSCVERAAATLVEAGCGDMPLAAVRGSNLLPILEMLEGDGISLQNAETGARWRELTSPILAADLQLGAGPLTLALAEQARVIVAGAFAGASAVTAAAVHTHRWKWQDYDLLAAAGAASNAAIWLDWQAFAETGDLAWRPHRVELDAAGRILLEPTLADESAAQRLRLWLEQLDAGAEAARRADARPQPSSLLCEPAGNGQLAVQGIQGAASDDCWELEILYEAGFAAEALVEFASTSDRRWRQHLATMARMSLGSDRDQGLLTVEELQGAGGGGWLHLAFQSKIRGECQRFAEQIVKLAAAHRPHLRLSSGRPAVHVHCGRWPVRVPRDAVDIAVETRIAREWV